MKITQSKETRTVFSSRCLKCGKRIIGYSESNLIYNMEQHLEKHVRESLINKEVKK